MPFTYARTKLSCFLLIAFIYAASPVSAQLRADFTADKNGGCSPLLVSFTNRTTGASAQAVYSWDFNNGNTSAIASPGAIFKEEKNYTVTLTVKDGSAVSSKTLQVTVYKTPIADFTTSATKACIPAPVTFTSTGSAGDGSIVSYFWDYGDGYTQSGSSSQSHIFDFVQKASVSLTVKNNYGCYQTIRKDSIITLLPTLKAEFDADKKILCQPTDAVKFSNNSSGPGTLSYVWDYGDGNTSTQTVPAYSFNKRGIYTVKLTVNSSEGCTTTKTQSAYLNVASFTTDIETPSLVCNNSTANFTNKSTPLANSSYWEFDNVGYNYYSTYSAYQNYYQAGTHTVKLVNTYGTCKDSVTKQITVHEIPQVAGFISEITGNCGAPVVVNFKDTTSGAVAWKWNNDYYLYNTFSTAKTPSYTYNSDGGYYVSLTVTNAAGCSKTVGKPVSITRPYVNISVKSTTGNGYNSSCGAFDMKFAYSSSEELTDYNWVFSDGSSTKVPEPLHSFVTPGMYSVQLIYTTKSGCQGIAFYNNIQVYSKPKAEFTAVSQTICGNTPAIFNASGISGTNPHWYWFFGEQSPYLYDAGGPSPSHSYNDEGIYSVTLIAVNGTCADTITKKDYIKVQGPYPKITNVVNTCNGTRGEVTFTQASRLAKTWDWDFGDGTTLSLTTDQPTVKHTYTRTGSFTVTLTTSNDNCTLKDFQPAYVLLKQQPVLTANKKDFCNGEDVTMQATNFQQNPYPYYYADYQYYYQKAEFADGTTFNGSRTSSDYYWATTYNSTFKNFPNGTNDLRIIFKSTWFGCEDTSNYVPIKVKGPVVGFDIPSNNVCWKSPVVFRDTTKSTGNVPIRTWEWNFGDGNIDRVSSGGTINHNYSNPGQYYVSLKVTDADGCFAVTNNNYNSSQYATVNGPKAAFSMSGSNLPLNSQVYFYNNSNTYNSYPTDWSWSFGDGSTSSQYYPTHTYTVAGTYTVKLVASNPLTQCKDSTTQTIVIRDFNSAFTSSTSYVNGNGCPPLLARFNNTSVGARRITWDFGDGTVADNQYYPTHSYHQAGVYKVTLFVYGDNGLTGTFVDTIIVSKPAAKIESAITKGCVGQQFSLNAAAPKTSLYAWDFGDGFVTQSADSAASHVYLSAGTYQPSVMMSNNASCPVTAQLNDKIIIDAGSASVTPKQPEICRGAAVQLIASGGVSYSWLPAQGLNTTAGATVMASPLTNGKFVVEVTNDFGCKKRDSVFITVRQPFDIKLVADTFVCEGNAVQLPASGANSYQWINNTIGLSNVAISSPFARPSITSTYTVVGADAYQCFTDTVSVMVNVKPSPTVNIGPDIDVPGGDPIPLTATTSNNVNQYSWSPAAHLSCTNCAAPMANPGPETMYVLKVQTAFGCVASDTMIAKLVCDESRVLVPNAFSPNGDGVNDVFSLKGSGTLVRHFKIYGRWGDVVFEKNNFSSNDRRAGWNGMIKGEPAVAGTYVYFIELQCATGQVFTRKGTVVLVR